MFAKLKKKIAEEAATAPRTGVRIPRTISKESITSVGADSGDDFASDGSSSRDDLPAQLLRRNDQIRRLEAKLSDYAEQLRLMQKTKDKLEIALEKHQDSSIKKLQDQNETHVASRAKMAEGMTLALEKKDQEWMEKLEAVEMEKAALSAQLNEMSEQSLALFQKRDDRDELEGFQQQELAKVKHMLLRKEEKLGQRERELQLKESEVQSMKRGLSEARERLQRLDNSLIEEDSRNLLQKKELKMFLTFRQAALTEEEKERTLLELQKKVASLERRLQGNLSPDEHLQELLQEVSTGLCSIMHALFTFTITVLYFICGLVLWPFYFHKLTRDSKTWCYTKSIHKPIQKLTHTATFPKLLKPFLIIIEQLFCLQADVSGQHKICTEITKALEDTRRQKEELQARVSNLSLCFLSNNSKTVTSAFITFFPQVAELTASLLSGAGTFFPINNALLFPYVRHPVCAIYIAIHSQFLCETVKYHFVIIVQMSFLEVEVETLTEQQQQQPEVCEEEQNGSVTVDDLDHIQKVNRDLEQQLSEKNRTIKQLQQRLAELKRTLQKELKLKPEGDPPSSNTTVTNTSDLNDSREINFEYLKHVILKFMSCREAEAFHLIRAVSVLLNFTREEEDLLKQTLEYKMSWFGSKPSPKGIIRPSISGSSTHWS
uniref:Golgin subfamily A member 1 n=1 Tax=Neogobius melanostomus TaxID=47308 RepID=A0A8C6TC03_9GOBI